MKIWKLGVSGRWILFCIHFIGAFCPAFLSETHLWPQSPKTSDTKSDGFKVGNHNVLPRMDIHKVDRELYKFLHGRLTVKLKAASIMTCQPGQGFELYRMINSKLDPCNPISEQTILADVRRLAFMKCKGLGETKLHILQLINICNEFCDKTCKEVDNTEKMFAIWLFLDEMSRLKAERKNLIEGPVLRYGQDAPVLRGAGEY